MVVPTPKPAATVMLLREKPSGIEVLLLQRNKSLKFAPGFWVFPGGKIEKEELAPGRDIAEFGKITAVRETKEETQLEIEVDDLIFFSHWTTPIIEPRRFATWFYFAEISANHPPVKVDGSEIIDFKWVAPKDVLEAIKSNEIMLMPPTLMSIIQINHYNSLGEAKAKISRSKITYITPVLHFSNGKMISVYKGDYYYNKKDLGDKGSKHRIIWDMKNGGYEYLYEGCNKVPRIDGR